MRHAITILLLSLSFWGCKELPYDIWSIDHQELLKHKVDVNRFELGWFPASSPKTPLFRDYSILDTAITPDPQLEATSIYHPSNQPKKIGLTLTTDSISLDNRKKLFSINGKITGGFNSTKPEDLKVFIGQRKDTMVNVTFMASPHIDNYYKGEKIDRNIDFKVPAFYLHDYHEFPVVQNEGTKENILHITTLISEKSVLVIALGNRYATIFEIGGLITTPED